MLRRHFTLGLLAATSACAVTGTVVAQTSAPSGAMLAMEYLALASKGGTFLETTGRIGFEKGGAGVRRFSRAEVVEQVNLADKLDANGGVMAARGGAPTPGGVVGGLVAAPFVVAGAAVGAAGAVLGGVPMTPDGQKAQMVAQLQATPAGPSFDAAFVEAQLMGHKEALAIHGTYAQSGDNPALRRVARGALPLIRLHIAQLTRMQRGMGASS